MHTSVIRTTRLGFYGSRQEVDRLASYGYDASTALSKAFRKAEELAPEVGTVTVTAKAGVKPYGKQSVQVPENLLPEVVAALIADPTVTGIAVGNV